MFTGKEFGSEIFKHNSEVGIGELSDEAALLWIPSDPAREVPESQSSNISDLLAHLLVKALGSGYSRTHISVESFLV